MRDPNLVIALTLRDDPSSKCASVEKEAPPIKLLYIE
jgi:hypothetical protein